MGSVFETVEKLKFVANFMDTIPALSGVMQQYQKLLYYIRTNQFVRWLSKARLDTYYYLASNIKFFGAQAIPEIVFRVYNYR